jgi:hypothetical protein
LIVISDTSPLVALAAVGKLDLLHSLYGEILIPQAVHREATGMRGWPGAAAISGAQWIRIEPADDRTLVAALALELDIGEAEAIALAMQHRADLLLMDERRGLQRCDAHGPASHRCTGRSCREQAAGPRASNSAPVGRACDRGGFSRERRTFCSRLAGGWGIGDA